VLVLDGVLDLAPSTLDKANLVSFLNWTPNCGF
jgi:hypothetical protein